MKDRTKNCFKKLADLTNGKCQTCPVSEMHRCCDKMFCNLVEGNLKRLGITLPKPSVGNIPYMSDKGCIVSPELRPYCTGFACPPHFEDREFRREYDRLVNKIGQDKDAPPMPKIMRSLKAMRK